MKSIEDWEHARQGFADTLDFIIPYMPKNKRIVATATIEAYHRFADRKVVQCGGESVNRKYKTPKGVKYGI